MAKRTQNEEVEVESEDPVAVEEAPAKVETMRCYSKTNGLVITLIPIKTKVHRDDYGKREVEIVRAGVDMVFTEHRCDLPRFHEQHPGVDLWKLALKKREQFFVNDWITAEQMADSLDDVDNTIVSEMFRRSVVGSHIRPGQRRGRGEITEHGFAKLIRNELKELGYVK